MLIPFIHLMYYKTIQFMYISFILFMFVGLSLKNKVPLYFFIFDLC